MVKRLAEASSSLQHAVISIANAAKSYWKVVRPAEGDDDDNDNDDDDDDDGGDDGDGPQVKEITLSEAVKAGFPTEED